MRKCKIPVRPFSYKNHFYLAPSNKRYYLLTKPLIHSSIPLIVPARRPRLRKVDLILFLKITILAEP